MRALIFLVAALATAAALPPVPPVPWISQREVKCIDGCKCTLVSNFAMKVTRCSKDISLSDTTFANLSMEALNTIEFAGAVITEIKDSAFDALTNLEVIVFKNCRIDSLNEDAFDLPTLDRVSFNGCKINITSPFINSDRMRELVVTGCNLKKVPELGDMPTLEHLDLSHNYIRNVSKDAFEELDSLETLNLSNNEITFLPPSVFYDNTALTNLYLDNNPFKFFTVSDESPLEYLSISSCKLTTFDYSSTKFLTSVTHLNLSDNKIAMIPNNAFENMTSLEFLDLSKNNLKHLDVNVLRKNKKLEKLILNNNRFVTLPPFAIARGTFAISYFSCKHCGLSVLSKDTFKNMPSIQILDLSENYFLENIEGVLKFIPSLVELDVSNNSIIRITPNTFIDNRNLKVLKLRGNILQPLNPKCFTNNQVLNLLDVSNTGLSQIWANNKTKLPSIKTLYISNNAIQKLTTADLNVTPGLKNIYLEKNKLQCNSDFKQAIKLLTERGVRRLGEVHDDLPDFISGTWVKPWRELVKNVCPNDNDDSPPAKTVDVTQLTEYFDREEDEEEEDVLPEDSPKPGTKEFSEYYYYYDDDESVSSTSTPSLTHNRDQKQTPTPRTIQQDLDEYDDLKLGPLEEEFDFENRYTLTKTSYIVLVTSVFMLTALLVVVVTVSCTVLILKKNRNLQLERANLPRFRIPLWSTTPSQKKHSGSVYQTLTEDYSGPKTPIVSRYEFNSTPSVHNPSTA